jgi:hypothetical protein
MTTKLYSDPISVEVTDTGALVAVAIFALSPGGVQEVVYASAAGGEAAGVGTFGTLYASGSRVAITGGYRYTFSRAGGWVGAGLVLTALSTDDSGTLTVASSGYAITAPTVAAAPAIAAAVSADVPIDFLQDANGDLDLTTGDLQFATGIAGVGAAQLQNLQMALGEYFLDLSAGLDYFGSILVKNPNLMLIRRLVAEQLADVPFVTQVDRVALSLASDTRTLTATCSSSCDFGTVAIDAALAAGGF